MIRLTYRFLGLVLLIAILGGLGRLAHSTWIEIGSMRSGEGIRLDQTDLSLVYEVPRFEWLEFPAPGARRVARVIAHADVLPNAEAQSRKIYQFMIRARFVDAGGEQLGERNMRFRTRVVEYRDSDSGELYRRTFYAKGGPQPTSTQETRLALPGTEVHSIQFQLVEMDPDVHAVQLRLYKQEPPAESRLEKAWERLGMRTRNLLASGNLYPVEFLTAREKVNLVRNRWKPAGPRGIEGEDYRVREMRVFRSRSGEPAGTAQAGNGVYVARWLNLPIRVPESGRLRLQFESADPTDVQATESPLQVAATQYSEGNDEPAASLVQAAGDGSVTLDAAPGLVDLQFSRPGYVRAYLRPASRLEQELDIERIAVRNYLLDPSEPMVFPVRHAGPEGTTLRVDLACQCSDSEEAATQYNPVATFRIRAADGSTLQEGSIRNPAPVSRYAYVRMSVPTPVTETSRYVIHLPPRAADLELLGESGLMASVFSRPRDLPRRMLVSGDTGERSRDELRRTWFPLRPVNYESVRNSVRSGILLRGPQPPEPDLERRLGTDRWERFEPDGDWVGRYLLEPREADSELAARALGAVFRKIPPNRETTVNVQAAGIANTVPMRLIVRRDSGHAVPVRVWLDGRISWRGRFTGKTAELAIGRIKVGERRLRVEIPGSAEVLVNYAGSGEASFSKRLAIRVRDQVMEIPFAKRTAEEETLSGVVYLPADAGRKLRIRADILGQPAAPLRMYESATVSGSELEIVGDGGPSVRVLNASQTPELVARRFYFPLGQDLPAGSYRIRLTFDSVAETYLILSRSVPGSASTRFLRHETLGPEGEI